MSPTEIGLVIGVLGLCATLGGAAVSAGVVIGGIKERVLTLEIRRTEDRARTEDISGSVHELRNSLTVELAKLGFLSDRIDRIENARDGRHPTRSA